jgi:hypothetical protein
MDREEIVVSIYAVLVAAHILEEVVTNLWKLQEELGSWEALIVTEPMHQVTVAQVVKLKSFGFALNSEAKPNFILDEK